MATIIPTTDADAAVFALVIKARINDMRSSVTVMPQSVTMGKYREDGVWELFATEGVRKGTNPFQPAKSDTRILAGRIWIEEGPHGDPQVAWTLGDSPVIHNPDSEAMATALWKAFRPGAKPQLTVDDLIV